MAFRFLGFFTGCLWDGEISCHRFQHIFDMIAQHRSIRFLPRWNQSGGEFLPILQNGFDVIENKL